MSSLPYLFILLMLLSFQDNLNNTSIWIVFPILDKLGINHTKARAIRHYS
jgi:hypothetical protein